MYSDLILANLIVTLIYISLVVNDVEHLFIHLLAIWVFSKVKMLLSVSRSFLYRVVLMQDFPKLGPREH